MNSTKGILQQSSFSTRLFLFFFVFVFCFLVGLLVGIELFGDSMTLELSSYKLLQLVQSVSSFLLPPLLFAYLCSTRPLEYLSLNRGFGWKPALLVVLAMVVAVPCINLLAWLNGMMPFPAFMSGVEEHLRLMEQQAELQTDRLLYTTTWSGLLFNLFLVAVLPALGEELFFRGALQRLFSEWKPGAWTIWLTAFVFSAIHMQFFGFVPRLLMGAFFGYLLLWSGSIWLPIIAHFVNNGLVVLYHFLSKNGYAVVDMEHLGTEQTWWVGVLSGVAFALVVWRLARRRQ